MRTKELEECRAQAKKLDAAIEVYGDCEVDDISVSRASTFDSDDDFDEDDEEDGPSIATDDEDASEAFTAAVETIVDAVKWVPKLLAEVDNAANMQRRLQGEIEAKGLAVDEWQAMKKLLREMLIYRKQVGPLGFQVEKFDGFLDRAEALMNPA